MRIWRLPREGRAVTGLLALVALLVAAVWFALSPPWADDLIGGDEGYYGTMARNVLASPQQLVSPALSPLGPPGDKPPLYPLLLAPLVHVWGAVPAAVRVPSAVCAVVVTASLGVLLVPVAGVQAGLFATLLFATLPWFADAARGAAAEAPLTALTLLALVLLAGAPRSRGRALVAGALLGLAFLCKLWLVAPAALAAVALVAARDRRGVLNLVLLTGSALIVASLHLAVVAVVQPADFEHWRYIYLGRSLVERVQGEGYADYWLRPPGTYWAIMTRALGLVLPWVANGVRAAWRRRGEPVPRALLVWAAGLLLLSVFQVKTGNYVFVVMPAWAALAALGLAEAAAGRMPGLRWLAAGALLSSPLGAVIGADGLPWPVWAVVWGSAALVSVGARLFAGSARRLAMACALLALALGTGRSAQRLSARFHTPGYQDVAALVAPRLATVHPAIPCMVAPEAPVFDFHLFRTALYWATPGRPWNAVRLEQVQRDTLLRVFVVDTSRTFHGGWPDDATLAWLERDLREITSELPSRPYARPLRVFVREPVRPAAAIPVPAAPDSSSPAGTP
ncbi:MAG: glycosyltransferase family 39 protein [Candidatus Eisenbacteria bacterium]